MIIENIAWSNLQERVVSTGGHRTRNLLITSRTRIQLSHRSLHHDQIFMKECCRPVGGRTRNLLITSRSRIQLSHRGRQMCCNHLLKSLQHLRLLQFVNQGPVVQSVGSLTNSLRVISSTVLADSIYNILIFFAVKMWVAFALQKLLTFFQQKISAYLRITRLKF